MVSSSGYGTYSRSPAAPYVENEGTRTWGRIDNDNGYPYNGNKSLGFANPRECDPIHLAEPDPAKQMKCSPSTNRCKDRDR